ncbi:M1 family metallopeptidase [Arenibacter sp. BSSL-BM3]|uniref:M1 family metallopeptidase n=1 Tax=Arenibacter arenosicollis TaxID=2762274 RepID=A0ABR7QP42_9FLAO|nr:M1 family metallopeptidase [Arenibacter arenosicollis]MBC8768926.1 M1 family metallopeptidase [Arenibacter arenosicollis]
MKKIITVLLLALGISSFAQHQNFTEQDSLRGSITPERSWWDLNFYNLSVEVKPEERFISGSNEIRYTVLEEQQRLQVDLQPPLIIEKITQEGENLKWESNGNAHFVTLKKPQLKGEINEIKVYYSGHPKEAVRAPWDGGFSWKKDNNGKHFAATSCQGLGASVWWPNKDHMYDEVDSMAISITTPKGLMDVSNGRLLKVEEHKDSNTYHWYVANPINNYGVNINMGDYVHFGESYSGEKGELTMDYYVLRDNLEKAKKQFKQAPLMMEAFEHWFGPYPFYEDGYKLVEAPYLGMEHQSSVTYGNQFKNGYLGNDLSKTGWGLKFDFILIHESGHEWFANNITYKDIADMWIHESFTAYSENLYVDYHFGKKAASEYVLGTRGNIQNDSPIIGTYNVNQKGSGDMYYKGANMLHTLRQLVEDDEKWRTILRGLNKEFYHKTVTTKQIEDYISKKSGIDLTEFFDQYLRGIKIPILEFQVKGKQLRYHYINIVDGFDMPIKIDVNGTVDWLYPTAEWKTETFKKTVQSVAVDENFYVASKKI